MWTALDINYFSDVSTDNKANIDIYLSIAHDSIYGLHTNYNDIDSHSIERWEKPTIGKHIGSIRYGLYFYINTRKISS